MSAETYTLKWLYFYLSLFHVDEETLLQYLELETCLAVVAPMEQGFFS